MVRVQHTGAHRHKEHLWTSGIQLRLFNHPEGKEIMTGTAKCGIKTTELLILRLQARHATGKIAFQKYMRYFSNSERLGKIWMRASMCMSKKRKDFHSTSGLKLCNDSGSERHWT